MKGDKKKESKEKKVKKPSKVMMFLRDERFHFALGIVLFFSSLYLLLAMMSFFFTGGADQNIVLADGVSRADMKRQVVNWTGVNGALLANYLINECFGVSVFALLSSVFAVSALCAPMLCAVACSVQDEEPVQTDEQTTLDELTEQTTEEQSREPEETTEGEITVNEARAIGERYFIYRIWNFTPMSQAQFEATVDAAAETGFNAIKVHIPWSRVESKTAGEYDFSAFDPMIEYVVKTKGMKVAISIDLTRRADDKIIPLDQMQYDPNGNLCKGGSIDGMRTMISFCSESAVASAVAFYSAAVERYEAKYASDILFYLPAFSQYAESEYWCAGEYDYSDLAKQQFRAYLQEKYATIADLNYVLGTEYASFDQIEPPSSLSSDNFGQLWYQFRHLKLKGVIDALALAQKQISPDSKYCLQFGSIFDTASILRCTLAAAELAEYADVVWIDDGPMTEHEFSMDHANATFPSHILLAQEIDGPNQVGATPERYLEQGNDAFTRGCTYLSIANW